MSDKATFWDKWPIWRTLLMVTLATYVPFVWLLVFPNLLLACGGPWVPGFVAGQFVLAVVFGLGPGSFLCQPFLLTVLTLAFFTWLGRRGGRMRVVATRWALVCALVQSAGIGYLLTHFHT